MYVTLRRYAGAGARADEIAQKVEQGLVPVLKRQPGFKGYCAMASEDGDAVSVSVFEQRQQATEANDRARGWVQENLRDLLPHPPEVFAGECGFAEVSREHEQHAGAGKPLFVVIRKFEKLGPVDKAREFVRQNTLPVITSSPGFRGVYIFRSDADGSRGANVTLFDSRENAMRSHERVVQILREKGGDVVPAPTRVVMGQTRVLAIAG